jgi:hypothetical protein
MKGFKFLTIAQQLPLQWVVYHFKLNNQSVVSKIYTLEAHCGENEVLKVGLVPE